MPSGMPKSQLDGSWVVEGEDESLEYSPEEGSPLPRATPRRSTRSSNRSPEPELIMPSLDPETLEASWADTTSSSTRPRRGIRSTEKESRRRISHRVESIGSPEKRLRTKTFMDKIPSVSSDSASTLRPIPREANSLQDIIDVCIDYSGIMASWLFEVVGGSLQVLKRPISYLLAVWLLFGMGVMLRNLVTNSVYASLSPICRVPGISFLNLPFCPTYQGDAGNGPPPVEFDQLMTMQSKFEEVMEESASSVSLPMDMKHGEASIRDLRQLVRYSQLSSK